MGIMANSRSGYYRHCTHVASPAVLQGASLQQGSTFVTRVTDDKFSRIINYLGCRRIIPVSRLSLRASSYDNFRATWPCKPVGKFDVTFSEAIPAMEKKTARSNVILTFPSVSNDAGLTTEGYDSRLSCSTELRLPREDWNHQLETPIESIRLKWTKEVHVAPWLRVDLSKVVQESSTAKVFWHLDRHKRYTFRNRVDALEVENLVEVECNLNQIQCYVRRHGVGCLEDLASRSLGLVQEIAQL